MTIKEYCEQRGISLAEFARLQGVEPQRITRWINAGWRIFDGRLYSPKRELNT